MYAHLVGHLIIVQFLVFLRILLIIHIIHIIFSEYNPVHAYQQYSRVPFHYLLSSTCSHQFSWCCPSWMRWCLIDVSFLWSSVVLTLLNLHGLSGCRILMSMSHVTFLVERKNYRKFYDHHEESFPVLVNSTPFPSFSSI